MSFPYDLTNGQNADANQVMANFNATMLAASGTASNPTFTGTITAAAATFSGAVNGQTINAAGQLLGAGTTTNDNAATGYIGEYLSSTVLSGSAVSLSGGVAKDITTLALTGGDWDVWGTIALGGSMGASTFTVGWISLTSATVPTVPNGGAYFNDHSGASQTSNVYPVGMMRISLGSTGGTAHLSVETSGTGGTGYGFIGARRAR